MVMCQVPANDTEDLIVAVRHYAGSDAHEFRQGDPVKVKPGYDAWFATHPSAVPGDLAVGQLDSSTHFIEGFEHGLNCFDIRAFVELAAGRGRSIPLEWLEPVDWGSPLTLSVADLDAIQGRLDAHENCYPPPYGNRLDSYLSVAEVRVLLTNLRLAGAEIQRLRSKLSG